MEGQVTRRAVLRAASSVAALTTAGSAVGCARSGVTHARTVVQQPKTVLGLRAWGAGSGPQGSETEINALLYQATEPWRLTHSGVDVKIISNTGGPQAVITSILAGAGPDVYHSWHPGQIFANVDLTTSDLTPYLKAANVSPDTAFGSAQMALYTRPDGIRGLPNYLPVSTLAVNETLLDTLGLSYPAEGWTYREYGDLATAIVRSRPEWNKQAVVGSDFSLGTWGEAVYLPPDAVLHGFGGSYVTSADLTKSNFASAGSIQAVDWVYGLVSAKVLAGPGLSGDFARGTLGMTWAGSWTLPQQVTQWSGFKWRYYGMPSFPVTGPVTSGGQNFYALNPGSKNLDLAWDLMQWISFEPDWSRSMIKIFLLTPALLTLWDQWTTEVGQIAPPLANKDIAHFAELVTGNHVYPQQVMLYSNPQVHSLMDSWGAAMYKNQVSVREGLTQLARQIDGLEATGARLQAGQGAAAALFPTKGPTIATVQPGL